MLQAISVNIGHPRVMMSVLDGEPYTSSIGRRPASGPVELTLRGFANDSCACNGHAGENMAVNVFPIENYGPLEEAFGRKLAVPSFGENITLAGLPDGEARAGDVLQCGEAILQVSQPREPCGNIVRFLGLPGILKAMRQNLLTGYYLRVLAPGRAETGAELKLVERGVAEWTIERLNRAMFLELENEEQIRALQEVEVLSANWKRSLARQFEKRAARAARS